MDDREGLANQLREWRARLSEDVFNPNPNMLSDLDDAAALLEPQSSLSVQEAWDKQRSDAWLTVWEHCLELGMDVKDGTGLENVLRFISRVAEPQGKPVAWLHEQRVAGDGEWVRVGTVWALPDPPYNPERHRFRPLFDRVAAPPEGTAIGVLNDLLALFVRYDGYDYNIVDRALDVLAKARIANPATPITAAVFDKVEARAAALRA